MSSHTIPTTHPILLFDGVCNLCNRWIQFLILRDKKAIFRLAALQSEAGKELLQIYQLPTEYKQSTVLIHDNRAYTHSEAVLRTARLLGGIWQYAYYLRIIPLTWRDWIYSFIANRRYQWFGEKAQCMVPTPDIKKRFL